MEELSGPEKQFLLRLARQTLEFHLAAGHSKNPSSLVLSSDLTPSLQAKKGAFVTLTMKETSELRGCIGHFQGLMPLYKTVIENSINAATRDPRFAPVTLRELAALRIEISVLGKLVPAKTDDIIVGTHGLLVENGSRRGLYLPQVAVEWNWNRQEFLEHACQKASLPIDAWKDPKTRIQIFSTISFKET